MHTCYPCHGEISKYHIKREDFKREREREDSKCILLKNKMNVQRNKNKRVSRVYWLRDGVYGFESCATTHYKLCDFRQAIYSLGFFMLLIYNIG